MSFNDATAAILDIAKATFGEDVEYHHADGTDEEITGIFEENYVTVDLGGEAGTQSTKPACDVKLADLSAEPANGDTLTIRGTEYEVIEIQKDGRGGALLVLHES